MSLCGSHCIVPGSQQLHNCSVESQDDDDDGEVGKAGLIQKFLSDVTSALMWGPQAIFNLLPAASDMDSKYNFEVI